ncbi:MAG: bifunctional riboflavin kinase/FAD synthetase [Ignavibacteriales bacterium]|nr:MAG: bifunctional riboflavin kinase/FAD synthetase [Ignavibacteriales bacterium]
MQVFRHKKEIKKDNNTVLTIGTFDGIHQGHSQIINKVKEIAGEKNSRSFFITFDPHPRKVISKNYDIKLLTTLPEKIEILNNIGIDGLYIIRFTREFSRLTSTEFFREFIIDTVGLSDIIIGFDHHFGKDRSGDIETVKALGAEYGFNVTIVEPYSIDDDTVSSTKIRNALSTGDLKKANKFLGRYYSFNGKVIKGDMRGRELGFPTANLELTDDDKLLPALGIYAVEIVLDEMKYYGLLSIGKRPTFHNSGHIVPEVYIYNFEKEIYGEVLKVNLVERIRDEEKYSDADELIKQMNRDKQEGLRIFNKVIQLINPG